MEFYSPKDQELKTYSYFLRSNLHMSKIIEIHSAKKGFIHINKRSNS